MKVQLFLCVTMLVSVAMLAVTKIRKKERAREDKRSRFEDIKLQVTHDVLMEYQAEETDTQTRLEKIQGEFQALQKEVDALQAKTANSKGQAVTCQNSAKDSLPSVETEFNNLKAETEKEKTSWSTEVETLKQQLDTRSPVCNFLKEGSTPAGNLCANAVITEAPKQEEPKAEAPKQEKAKAEPPKQVKNKGKAQKKA